MKITKALLSYVNKGSTYELKYWRLLFAKSKKEGVCAGCYNPKITKAQVKQFEQKVKTVWS